MFWLKQYTNRGSVTHDNYEAKYSKALDKAVGRIVRSVHVQDTQKA